MREDRADTVAAPQAGEQRASPPFKKAAEFHAGVGGLWLTTGEFARCVLPEMGQAQPPGPGLLGSKSMEKLVRPVVELCPRHVAWASAGSAGSLCAPPPTRVQTVPHLGTYHNPCSSLEFVCYSSATSTRKCWYESGKRAMVTGGKLCLERIFCFSRPTCSYVFIPWNCQLCRARSGRDPG